LGATCLMASIRLLAMRSSPFPFETSLIFTEDPLK
jgi:hypothetical protein